MGNVHLQNRDGGIRTHGLFVPNEARYQPALHPDSPYLSYHNKFIGNIACLISPKLP